MKQKREEGRHAIIRNRKLFVDHRIYEDHRNNSTLQSSSTDPSPSGVWKPENEAGNTHNKKIMLSEEEN